MSQFMCDIPINNLIPDNNWLAMDKSLPYLYRSHPFTLFTAAFAIDFVDFRSNYCIALSKVKTNYVKLDYLVSSSAAAAHLVDIYVCISQSDNVLING
jgi:hypothetical protein